MITVKVIAECRIGGVLHKKGAEVEADNAEARALEAEGYVDVFKVDGKPAVWGACCTEHQA